MSFIVALGQILLAW